MTLVKYCYGNRFSWYTAVKDCYGTTSAGTLLLRTAMKPLQLVHCC